MRRLLYKNTLVTLLIPTEHWQWRLVTIWLRLKEISLTDYQSTSGGLDAVCSYAIWYTLRWSYTMIKEPSLVHFFHLTEAECNMLKMYQSIIWVCVCLDTCQRVFYCAHRIIGLNQNEPGFGISRDLILFSYYFFCLFSKLNGTKKIA